MPSELADALRRTDPGRWRRAIPSRPDAELPFDAERVPRGASIALDTTVYIDELQGRLPEPVERLLARCVVLHGAVARAELALSIGHLDPDDARTPGRRSLLEGVLERMRPDRVRVPSRQAWTEAALLAGILARTQGLPGERRRALLNDALLLLTARESGAVLVSRNIADMGRLTALRPDAGILLYRIEGRPRST